MKVSKTKAAVAITGLLLSTSNPALAAPGDVALVGARVVPVSQPPIEKGTVLIRDGRIAELGVDVAVPGDARTIDVSGRIITPGLIAADTQLGLLEVGLEPQSNDARPEVDHPIRAAVRADRAFDLDSTLVGVARRHGVTSVISAPEGGLVSGRAGFFDLLDGRDPAAPTSFEGLVALCVRLGEKGAAAVGGSRLSAMHRFEEFLDDVRTYRTSEALYRRRGLYSMSAGRLDLAAAVPVLQGRMPAVIEVHRAADVRAVVQLANEYRLDLVLLGASEGWMVADFLAEEKIPVVVDPFANLPSSFERRNARADNGALLARAGVPVVLAARSNHNAGNLRFAAGNAVRAGFPAELALEAITLTPARVFGFDDRMGSLERGKRANLVVWTGDPFEPGSWAERVFVRGREQPLDSRQTRLARRYAAKLGLETTAN
ncbi:MAG: amidohydrolase family protein [Myxococcota bacterium]